MYHRDISDFAGVWYYDDDLSAETYIIIDEYGNWSYFQRVPGDYYDDGWGDYFD